MDRFWTVMFITEPYLCDRNTLYKNVHPIIKYCIHLSYSGTLDSNDEREVHMKCQKKLTTAQDIRTHDSEFGNLF